jgi:hypothetical protein
MFNTKDMLSLWREPKDIMKEFIILFKQNYLLTVYKSNTEKENMKAKHHIRGEDRSGKPTCMCLTNPPPRKCFKKFNC